MSAIREKLFLLAEEEYKAFQTKLMPTIDPQTVLGVRTPALRKLAKELRGTKTAAAFLKELPHTYYEENNLHAFLLECIPDYEQAVDALNHFLPFVDNWATCDSMNPKVLGKHLPTLEKQCKEWIASSHTYTVRYGIGMLMRYFLDKAFNPAYLALVASVESEEYYVNMMIAWYFATALAKQPSAALPYITNRRLDQWVHNKTIQKAVESYRIPDALKQQLRQLKCS